MRVPIPTFRCPRSRSHRALPALAILLASLSMASPGRAGRELEGQIFVGESMRLKIQLREGFFKELLRKLRLRSAPRKMLDLTQLGQDFDRIFIGTDFNLYVQKKNGDDYTDAETYKIGKATRLYDIRLRDDVTMEEVEDVKERFRDGGVKKGLRVGMDKKEPYDAEEVQRAGMEFFLNELVFEYDKPSTKGIDNYQIIRDALYEALPEGREGESNEQFQDFKIFVSYITDASDGDLLVFREFLTEKLERVRKHIQDPEDNLLKEYERLKNDVFERTAGF